MLDSQERQTVMVLTVRNYRGIDIDISRVTLGDILIVMMEHGNIHLMLTRYFNGLRWTYTKSSWLPVDVCSVDTLIKENPLITAIDGFGTIKNGRVDLYVPLNFRLDRPVVCTAEIRWEPDRKNHDRSRNLGTFSSAGGLVTEVTASDLSSIACTR